MAYENRKYVALSSVLKHSHTSCVLSVYWLTFRAVSGFASLAAINFSMRKSIAVPTLNFFAPRSVNLSFWPGAAGTVPCDSVASNNTQGPRSASGSVVNHDGTLSGSKNGLVMPPRRASKMR